MENSVELIKLDSVETYNNIHGFETLNPLVSVVDISDGSMLGKSVKFDYGIYALFLKQGVACTIKYGREPYDYGEGTVVFLSPGQIVEVTSNKNYKYLEPHVIGLLFHPQLLQNAPLGLKMKSYAYFNYSQREALHLSQEERKVFLECVNDIQSELRQPVDRHTNKILASKIMVLLDYLDRFYDRQFITRHEINSNVLQVFEKALKDFYSIHGGNSGLPTVSHFAQIVNLTPGYFGDLIKKETGSTAQELIAQHIIGLAKERLSQTDDDIAIIAYDLGFQYPQHFSRMFKRLVGDSPSVYRKMLRNK